MALLIVLALSQMYRFKYTAEMETYYKEMQTAVNITEVYVNEKITDINAALKILAETNAVESYINQPTLLEEERVKKIFAQYITHHSSIRQLRILDTKGMERVRVDKSGDTFNIIDASELQDKSDRYYFQDALKLNKDNMYISDFDLNVERGEIVVPYEPTIRFIIKLYDSKKNEVGMLVLNVDGYAMFDTIKEYEVSLLEHREIGILDEKNYWSFSKMLNEDNPNPIESVYLNVDKHEEIGNLKQVLMEQETLSGKYVVDSKYIIYKKMRITNEENYLFSTDKARWYVMGQYDKKALFKDEQFFLYNIVIISLLSGIFGGIIIYGLLIFYQIKTSNGLLLIAASYIADNAHDGIIILDKNQKIIYCNHVFEEIYSTQNVQVVDKYINEIFENEIVFNKESDDEEILWKGNIWNSTQYGNVVCKHLTVKAIKNSQNNVAYYVGIYVNPEETNKNQQAFLRESMNAFLMRTEEVEFIGKEIYKKYNKAKNYIILTMQLTGSIHKMFEANQELHAKFLAKAFKMFEAKTELHILVTPRTGLVIFGHANNREGYNEFDIKEMIDQIKSVFIKIRNQMQLEQLDMNFYIGVAIRGKHGEHANQVFKNSMIALEALVKFKKNQYLLYDKKYHDAVKEDLKIRDALEYAFENNEFKVVYQPQFNVENNQIIGAEALVRWESQLLGNVRPDRFIPILEETEGILRLGLRVLDLVIEDFKAINVKNSGFRISFNLSPKEFLDVKSLEAIIQKINILFDYGLKVCVEITETALIENYEFANMTIQSLRELGVEVAIDDFGTGYSSLSYLKTLRTNELKIDRIFIREYPLEDDGKILKGIISMGKEIKMQMVAEGIETQEQLELIQEMQCDYYQGYYGSKPIPIEEMKAKYGL